jgi:4'-phosphopantetheinyl transferase
MTGTQCEVWWATPAVQTPALLGLLDAVERERHDAFRREIDRSRFLTARAVAKATLGRKLGVEPASVVLDSTCPDCGRPHGKPRVVRPPGYPADRPLPEMSISHSGQRVAVAVTEGMPVGVDVEQVRDVQVIEMARLTLSTAELETFTALAEPDREAAFFTYWSRKEALLKATGRGLSIGMTKVTISTPDQPPVALASETSEVDVHSVRMVQLDAPIGYYACVAVLDASEPIGVTEHDADPLLAGLG